MTHLASGMAGRLFRDQVIAFHLGRTTATYGGVEINFVSPLPVTDGGCIEWPFGAKSQGGYGILRDKDFPTTMVTRQVLSAVVRLPEVGEHALHSCDNPPCINPAHLRWGTQAANISDMWSRGRRTGSPNRKITEDDVHEIDRLVAAGHTHAEVAARFVIGKESVSAIVTRRNWKHVIRRTA